MANAKNLGNFRRIYLSSDENKNSIEYKKIKLDTPNNTEKVKLIGALILGIGLGGALGMLYFY